MAHAALDTLSMAQRLEREFDFPPKQAEGTAMLLHEHITGNVATKEDIAALKKDITALEKDIAALEKDISALEEKIDTRFSAFEEKIDARIADVKNDLKWIKVIGAVIVAAVITPWLTELLAPYFN